MELAEKGVNKLKEENPAEAAIDFMGTESKQRKAKGREERKGHKGNQQGAKKEPQPTNHFKFSKYNNNNNSNKCVHLKTNDIVCFRCRQGHLASSCTLPRSVKCRECGGFGHLQKVCKKKDQAHMLEEVCSVTEQEHFEHRAKFTVPLRIENRDVVFDVDCGSAVTLVSEIWLKNTFPKLTLCKTRLKLRSYCKQNFVPLGENKSKRFKSN